MGKVPDAISGSCSVSACHRAAYLQLVSQWSPPCYAPLCPSSIVYITGFLKHSLNCGSASCTLACRCCRFIVAPFTIGCGCLESMHTYMYPRVRLRNCLARIVYPFKVYNVIFLRDARTCSFWIDPESIASRRAANTLIRHWVSGYRQGKGFLVIPKSHLGVVQRLRVGADPKLSSEGIMLTSDELNNTSVLLR